MYLGRHYLKKEKWIAAINRFKTVIEKYDQTIFVEEALHRLVEINFKLGLKDESQKYANILGYNYLSSDWYKKSYKVFNQDYSINTNEKIQKDKKGVLAKFKNSLINMDKKLIRNEYEKKVKLLNYYNRKYFNENLSEISDSKYDLLKKEIEKLEEKYNFLKDKNSPTLNVGYKPSRHFKKVLHKVPMLSLSNAFSEEDLRNFEKKILNYLDKSNNFEIEYSAEPKIDGISASLIYQNGKFRCGLSRGDGKEGEDISENLKTIKDIPQTINHESFPKEIDIRGEVFIQNSDFSKFKEKFANPSKCCIRFIKTKKSRGNTKDSIEIYCIYLWI